MGVRTPCLNLPHPNLPPGRDMLSPGGEELKSFLNFNIPSTLGEGIREEMHYNRKAKKWGLSIHTMKFIKYLFMA